MQDDIRPGAAPMGSRKPKTIQPLNDLSTAQVDTIDSFTDDEPSEQLPQTQAAPVAYDAAEDQDAVASIHQVDEPVESDNYDQQSPPADVAVTDTDIASEEPAATDDEPKRKFSFNWPPSKKQRLIIAGVVVLLAGGGTAFALTRPDPAPVAKQSTKKVVAAAPKPLTSNLTGLPITDASVNERPVTGVMIENSPDARPQSGLDQAGIVFEAIAEGGVTRFMAVFQDSQPDYIGPVRSARPYYVQWCLSFDCAYAHVGGSPDGLAGIKSWNVKDLDQFANSGAYHRISSRYAPHNVYTSIAELNKLEGEKGYGAAKYTGFSRKADQIYKAPDPAATGAAAKNQDIRAAANSIDFTMSGFYYDPHFDYDVATNTYKRSEAGQPHMEQHGDGSQVQIAPKVVVGMVVGLSAGALDAQGSAYSNYQTVGSGDALVFQDGTVTKIKWTKPDISSPISFTDDAGKPFKLNAGQTWITAITDAGKASYK